MPIRVFQRSAKAPSRLATPSLSILCIMVLAAGTVPEKAICADPRLSFLDERLNKNYRTLTLLMEQAGNHTQSLKAVEERQEKWLTERNACGADAFCIANAYGQRLAEIDYCYLPDQPAKHSGGGLATTAALQFHAPATVFDPAALHPRVARKLGLNYDEAGRLATVYAVEGDPVTAVQDSPLLPLPTSPHAMPNPLPSAPGRRIPLDPPPHTAVEGVNPWYYHDIDTLLEALRRRASGLGCSL